MRTATSRKLPAYSHKNPASKAGPLVEGLTNAHVNQLIDLMANGYSLYAACGALRIPPTLVADRAAEDSSLMPRLEVAKLQRLYHFESELLTTLNPARLSASMFALKNVDSAVWQDKPQQAIAVGVSAQITVITGVPESTQTTVKAIEHAPNAPNAPGAENKPQSDPFA
jgi:hypothetical protein